MCIISITASSLTPSVRNSILHTLQYGRVFWACFMWKMKSELGFYLLSKKVIMIFPVKVSLTWSGGPRLARVLQ